MVNKKEVKIYEDIFLHKMTAKDLKKLQSDIKKKEHDDLLYAKQHGFVKTDHPRLWFPKNKNIAADYLNSLDPKLKLKCPKCGKPLILRYMLHRDGEKIRQFKPMFKCSGNDFDHNTSYKVINNKLVSAE